MRDIRGLAAIIRTPPDSVTSASTPVITCCAEGCAEYSNHSTRRAPVNTGMILWV
jgi:hypothetical protein